MLIEAGPDVNTRDEKGDTPLSWQYDEGSVRLLIESGANVHEMNNIGVTPLQSNIVVRTVVQEMNIEKRYRRSVNVS